MIMSINSKTIAKAVELIDEAWNLEQASLSLADQSQSYKDLNPVAAPLPPKKRSHSRKVLDGFIWSEILKRKEY